MKPLDKLTIPDDSKNQELLKWLAACEETDVGNARRMWLRFRDRVHWSQELKEWLAWDGCRWVIGDEVAIQRLAKITALGIYNEIPFMPGKDETEDRVRHWRRTQDKRNIDDMIDLLKSEEGINVNARDLDSNPWLLNCLNGTLNLDTGRLLPHDPAQLLTKIAATSYDPAGHCPFWESLLSEWFLGREELIEYTQKFMGYSIVGEVSEHAVLYMHGTGQNGKSVFLNCLLSLLGDYGYKASSDLLVRKGDSHPQKVAQLFGKRLVVLMELDEGASINETLIKELSGGDVLNARFMYKGSFNFYPTHQLVVGTNHLPVLKGGDKATRRRVKIVPWEYTVPDDRVNDQIPAILQSEWPGILTWLVKGVELWKDQRLVAPRQVKTIVEEYLEEEDIIGNFIADCCEVVGVGNGEYPIADLYQAYAQWAAARGDRGDELFKQTDFARRLYQVEGVAPRRTNKTRFANGIVLLHSPLISTQLFVKPPGVANSPPLPGELAGGKN